MSIANISRLAAEIRARVARVPRTPLALTPTPMHQAPRLAAHAGIAKLFVKRDDLTGLGLGGNKVRNLEFRMAEAGAMKANVLIAGLEAQSNSARQSAAAANLLGMKTILVLRRGREWHGQGNLLIDHILGARIRWLEDFGGRSMQEALAEVAQEQTRLGNVPYVMNSGGAFALGSALGYLLCAVEILEQLDALSIRPTHLYMSSANKGHAGLVAARVLFDRMFRAVAISHRRSDQRVSGALDAARLALERLGYSDAPQASDVESYDDYVGEGYGIPSVPSMEAIRIAAETEGLLLDPVYTGKALAGLLDHAERGHFSKDSCVVFVHTGGQPSLFAWKDEILDHLDVTARVQAMSRDLENVAAQLEGGK